MMKNVLFYCTSLVILFVISCEHSSVKSPPITNQEEFARRVTVPSNIRIIEIIHEDGDVNVTGWDKPYILLEGTKRVKADSVGDAQYALQEIEIQAYERPPNRLVLEFKDSGSSPTQNSILESISYKAFIPQEYALDMEVRHGSVTVLDLSNDVSIDHRFGDVKAESIDGKLQIRSRGGVVTVNSIAKGLKLDTRESELFVKDIGGEAAIRHQEGDIEVSQVRGSLILNCKYAQITADSIGGRIELDNRRGDVVCTNFREGVRAYVNHGTLNLTPGIPVPQSYYCDVDDGSIILRVPEESSMILDVLVEDGRIHSDFQMNVGAEGGVSFGKGVNNEGRFEVRLRVRHGSASIFRSIDLPNTNSKQSPLTSEEKPVSNRPETSPDDEISESTLEE